MVSRLAGNKPTRSMLHNSTVQKNVSEINYSEHAIMPRCFNYLEDMMRLVLMIAACLLVATGCNESAEDQGTTAGQPTGTPGVSTESGSSPGSSATGAPAGGGNTEAGATDEAWPEYVPVYPGSETIDSGWQEDQMGRMFNASLESSDTIEDVKAFYIRELSEAGMRQVDDLISPSQNGCAFQHGSFIVSMGAQAIEDKATIYINVAPSPMEGDLPVSVNWYGLDDVPPGFPSDVLPRYPGSTILGASAIGEMMYYLELSATDSPEVILVFFDNHFAGLGWTEEQSSEDEFIQTKQYTKGDATINLNIGTDDSEVTHLGLSYETEAAKKFRETMEGAGGEVSSVD